MPEPLRRDSLSQVPDPVGADYATFFVSTAFLSQITEKFMLKIKNPEELKKDIDGLKREGKRIVFTNGCFDILHPGHTRYLYAARELGDYLIVAVNSDKSVRMIKEYERPVNPQSERAEILASLEFVDGVVIFDEDNPYEIIRFLMPDILVKGGDWAKEDIIGSDLVEARGGLVRSLPYVPGYSTTRIIEKISQILKNSFINK